MLGSVTRLELGNSNHKSAYCECSLLKAKYNYRFLRERGAAKRLFESSSITLVTGVEPRGGAFSKSMIRSTSCNVIIIGWRDAEPRDTFAATPFLYFLIKIVEDTREWLTRAREMHFGYDSLETRGPPGVT